MRRKYLNKWILTSIFFAICSSLYSYSSTLNELYEVTADEIDKIVYSFIQSKQGKLIGYETLTNGYIFEYKLIIDYNEYLVKVKYFSYNEDLTNLVIEVEGEKEDICKMVVSSIFELIDEKLGKEQIIPAKPEIESVTEREETKLIKLVAYKFAPAFGIKFGGSFSTLTSKDDIDKEIESFYSMDLNIWNFGEDSIYRSFSVTCTGFIRRILNQYGIQLIFGYEVPNSVNFSSFNLDIFNTNSFSISASYEISAYYLSLNITYDFKIQNIDKLDFYFGIGPSYYWAKFLHYKRNVPEEELPYYLPIEYYANGFGFKINTGMEYRLPINFSIGIELFFNYCKLSNWEGEVKYKNGIIQKVKLYSYSYNGIYNGLIGASSKSHIESLGGYNVRSAEIDLSEIGISLSLIFYFGGV